MRRRALRVMRPAREKKRSRRVFVVATGSPRPMRPSSELRQNRMGYHLHRQPCGVDGKAARGGMVEPHTVL